MTTDPAWDSIAFWSLCYADRLLPDCLASTSADVDLYSVAGDLLQVADRFDLDDAQRTQVKLILDAEGPNISVLIGQIIKSKRRLLAARHSSAFHETHEETLISEQRCLVDELNAAATRLRARIFDLLSDEQKAIDRNRDPAR